MIRANGAEPYEVTAEDVLWLLRAVEAEGEPRETVARALVNLFAWARAHGAAIGESLTKTVRAYAQPVNPVWANGGSRDKEPEVLSALEKRRAQAASREVFSPQTWSAVHASLGSSWRSDITDYAAPGVDASGKYVRRTVDVKGKNTMWSRAPGWQGYTAERSPMELVQEIRLLARALPASEQSKVESALQAYLVSRGRVGASEQTEWDLAAANTLDALYGAVSERVRELGRWGKDVALEGADVAERVVSAPLKPVTNVLLAVGLVMVLAYAWRKT